MLELFCLLLAKYLEGRKSIIQKRHGLIEGTIFQEGVYACVNRLLVRVPKLQPFEKYTICGSVRQFAK